MKRTVLVLIAAVLVSTIFYSVALLAPTESRETGAKPLELPPPNVAGAVQKEPAREINDSAKASPAAPFYPISGSVTGRKSAPILELILTPRSKADEEWMTQSGYPRLSDINGAVPDEALRKLALDYNELGPDPYAAAVLAARLYSRNDSAWENIAKSYGQISPFLARLQLEHELRQSPPTRLAVTQLDRLAVRAMLLGDYEVGTTHARSFNSMPWQILNQEVDRLAQANALLSRYGRPRLPVAVRPTVPDGP